MGTTSQQQFSSSAGPIMVEIVSDLDDLAPHADAWNQLALTAAPKLPTCSWAWLSCYFEHRVASNESWTCLFAYIGDQLLGVMPLHKKYRRIFGVPWSVLSLPKDDHTIAVAPLFNGENKAEVLDALIQTAWTKYPAAIWFDMPDVPVHADLLDHLGSYCCYRQSHRTGAWLPVTGNQDDYLASLSKNFRSNQRKAENKLKKAELVEYEFLQDAEANPDRLSDFMPVEASGWKGREGTAIQSSDELIAFYASLAQRLAQQGWLEWHFLRMDGNTIAANLGVRFGHGLLLWKLGYDEDARRYSPGGMLFQNLLDRSFIDPELNEINLLTEAPWYDNWRMARREYVGLRYYRPKRLRSLFLGYLPGSLIQLARQIGWLRKLVHRLRKMTARKQN